MSHDSSTRRAALSATPDARAVATRRRLARALHDELASGATDVSVTAVTRRAGIARSTFYTHFAAVEDLAVFVVSDIVDALAPLDVQRRSERSLGREEITRLGLAALLDKLSEQGEILVFATSSTSGATVRDRLVATQARGIELTMLTEIPDLEPSAVRMAAEFIAAGVIHVVLSWLAEPAGVTRDEILDALFRTLPAWLTSDSGAQPAPTDLP